jgi:hypothetical protein
MAHSSVAVWPLPALQLSSAGQQHKCRSSVSCAAQKDEEYDVVTRWVGKIFGQSAIGTCREVAVFATA